MREIEDVNGIPQTLLSRYAIGCGEQAVQEPVREVMMIRVIPAAAAVLFGVAPLAHAATCSEQMAEVSKMVDSAKSETKKQAAMQDMDQAKAALAKADEEGCVAHLNSARKRMTIGD